MRRRRSAGTTSRIRLAADIGGTFTDVAVFDDRTGALAFGKALSTPQRLVDGIWSSLPARAARFAEIAPTLERLEQKVRALSVGFTRGA